MGIIVDEAKTYEKPVTGSYIGVLGDVVDLGTVNTSFGAKRQVRLIWLLERMDGVVYRTTEGKHFGVAQQMAPSQNDKSNLTKIVRVLTGAGVGPGFDIERLIGLGALLQVETSKNEQTQKLQTKITNYFPLPAGFKPFAIPADFVRAKDRQRAPMSGNAQPPVAAVLPQAPVAAMPPAVPAGVPTTQVSGQPRF